ncbi:MAG: serine/threonine-protein kinase, partial [Wenzhouxiangellaceae bacterium]
MERVGRYEIVRELGRGTMSIVYEGFDGRIDRHLAIKVLRQRYARDVGARQRFLREARAAGGLAHPNIVTVFDVGQAEATPYLVMEQLQGGTLEDWLDRDRLPELDTGMLIELAIQLARGLAYAHQHGVIHRDIKPANIHYDPKTNVAKMMDFGIAATERSTEEQESGRRIAGTLTHMAPELLSGDRADARSDLYSLGVVLYQ